MNLRCLRGSKELDAQQQTIAAKWINKGHHGMTVAWNMALKRVTRTEFKKHLLAAQKESRAELSWREYMTHAFGAGRDFADWRDRAAAALAQQVDERQKEEAPGSSLAKDIVRDAADGDDDGDVEGGEGSREASNDQDEDASPTNMEGPKQQAEIRARDAEEAQIASSAAAREHVHERIAQLQKQLEEAEQLAASS